MNVKGDDTIRFYRYITFLNPAKKTKNVIYYLSPQNTMVLILKMITKHQFDGLIFYGLFTQYIHAAGILNTLDGNNLFWTISYLLSFVMKRLLALCYHQMFLLLTMIVVSLLRQRESCMPLMYTMKDCKRFLVPSIYKNYQMSLSKHLYVRNQVGGFLWV